MKLKKIFSVLLMFLLLSGCNQYSHTPPKFNIGNAVETKFGEIVVILDTVCSCESKHRKYRVIDKTNDRYYLEEALIKKVVEGDEPVVTTEPEIESEY